MKKKKSVFRAKRSSMRTALDILILIALLTVCGLADSMYQDENDWMRTLGHNYDFSGKNDEICDLYVGSFYQSEEQGQEPPDLTGSKKDCRLVNEGQSLRDSYFLLKRSDRRYALSHIYLELVCPDIAYDEDMLPEKKEAMKLEMLYLRKIIAYCDGRGLELTVCGHSTDTDEEGANIYMQYISEITGECGVECYWASSPSR